MLRVLFGGAASSLQRCFAAFAILACLWSVGCGSVVNSGDDSGERVEIKMLLPTEVPARPGEVRAQFAPVAVIAPIVIGFAVDAIQKSIEAEAELYERQYTGVARLDNFWEYIKDNDPNINGDQTAYRPRYGGFVVRRFTSSHPNETSPASESYFRFDYSKDQSVFLIRPVTLEVNSAKAKVAKKLNVDLNVKIQAAWLDRNQVFQEATVAEADTSVSDYDLKASQLSTKFNADVAGWFGGVPISYKPDPADIGKVTLPASDCGAFTIRVLVTERDTSKRKEILERVAKFVGDKKGDAMDFVGK